MKVSFGLLPDVEQGQIAQDSERKPRALMTSRNHIEIIPAANLVAECQILLRAAVLPYADIEPHLDTFFLARKTEKPVGVAGFEHYGDVALLRSVTVAESARGFGIGRQLCDACCSYASKLGVRSLYLLTETAADYFATMGFKEIPRNHAPPSIRNTKEFREFCPTSAVLMTRETSSSVAGTLSK